MRLATTEEEMQSQNEKLQDEVAAAERAQEMEGEQGTVVEQPTARCGRTPPPVGCGAELKRADSLRSVLKSAASSERRPPTFCVCWRGTALSRGQPGCSGGPG